MDAAIFAAEGCAPARCCDGYLKQHMACATCRPCTAPPVPDVCEEALLHVLEERGQQRIEGIILVYHSLQEVWLLDTFKISNFVY